MLNVFGASGSVRAAEHGLPGGIARPQGEDMPQGMFIYILTEPFDVTSLDERARGRSRSGTGLATFTLAQW
jgi:hypothetical protein